MAEQIANNFTTIGYIFQALSVIFGVGFTFGGIHQLRRLGESRSQMMEQSSYIGPLLMLLCGAVFLILPTMLSTFGLAFFSSASDLSYDASGSSDYLLPIIVFVRLVGVASFMRGIFLLSRSGGRHGQPGTLGRALIHMFAGLLCLHIVGTVNLLESILGLS